VAVLAALATRPNAGADTVTAAVRQTRVVSTQCVYDVLAILAERGILRRIQPAGSVSRYELRTGDDHHHVVCRTCGSVTDVDCAVGDPPCLEPLDLHRYAPGFALDEAEVTYWGLCATCVDGSETRSIKRKHDPTRSHDA